MTGRRSPQSFPPPEIAPTRKFWTTRELATLRAVWPEGGLEAAVAALPCRSPSGIYNRAGVLGLIAAAAKASGRITKRRNLIWSPSIDDAIRRAYAAGLGSGEVKKLARQLGRSTATLRYRAIGLGINVPRAKPEDWRPEEDAILREAGNITAKRGRLRLAKAGFIRSEIAVGIRIKRLGNSTRAERPDMLSAREAGELMGVDSHVVSRWIDRGWLAARKLPGERTPYLIKISALRDFLVEHVGVWDHRKCDIHWLVDILTNGEPTKRLRAHAA